MRNIYQKLKEAPGYEYIETLKAELFKLCEEYDIDGAYFVEEFIKMFKKCIYKNDRALAYEIWGVELYQEMHDMYIAIGEVKNILVSVQNLPATKSESTDADKGPDILSEEEKLLKWELHFPERDQKERTYKEKILYLTALWEQERTTVPGWYVIPWNKREILQMYTRGSELIYNKEDVSFTEQFNFTYELVWRYEMSFLNYSEKMQKRIQEIWDQAGEKENFLDKSEKIKEKYFFIGQALLRIHRENMQDEEWHRAFHKITQYSDAVITGKDQLQLENIKYTFMQMKITDVQLQLKNIMIDKEAYSVRMQAAGLIAECGMLDEAEKELSLLETEIGRKIKEESSKENKLEIVYYRSILACSYFLHRFVLLGLEPMRNDTLLHRLDKKIMQYKNYFDYETERSSFCREIQRQQKKAHKGVPFEINRTIRIICHTDTGSKFSYAFYRMLDRIAVPLHMNWVRLMDNDESELISGLMYMTPYVGWYMLLRLNSLDTVKNVLTRKRCIEINCENSEYIRIIFKYVYETVERTMDNMQGKEEHFSGNAYGHALRNGMEILRRLTSVATISEQKKLVILMLKLIDTDVVREHQTLNRWISQVMYVLDERVKISMLNELLQCSTRKRTMIGQEEELDPFDAFVRKTLAKPKYRQVDLEPQLVNNMLDRCEKSEQDKIHYIPRLGILADWNMLTSEQSKRFGEILWKDVDEEHFPMDETYYLKVYLSWPHPEDIDPGTRIKEAILSEKAFNKIKVESLLPFNLGGNRLFSEIRGINEVAKNFWTHKDLEFIVDEFDDCWMVLRDKFSKKSNKDFYEDEFVEQSRDMVGVLASFGRDNMKHISLAARTKIIQIAEEMSSYNIECMELRVLVCADEDLKTIIEEAEERCRNVTSQIVISAVEALHVLLLSDIDALLTNQICDALLELCHYRKEPGLHDFLRLLHDSMYLGKMELGESCQKRMSTILIDLDLKTDYTQVTDESENQVKDMIRTRIFSAHLAYQLYLYEEKKNMEHSEGTLLWKNICRGERSCTEFVEVRSTWI